MWGTWGSREDGEGAGVRFKGSLEETLSRAWGGPVRGGAVDGGSKVSRGGHE